MTINPEMGSVGGAAPAMMLSDVRDCICDSFWPFLMVSIWLPQL